MLTAFKQGLGDMGKRLGLGLEVACLAAAILLPPLLRWQRVAECMGLLSGLGLWEGIRMACWLLPPAVLAIYGTCLPLLAALCALACLSRRYLSGQGKEDGR